MRKISSKIFITMAGCACAAVLLLGIVSIHESASMAKQEESDLLVWMTRYYAEQFSREFEEIEVQVDELTHYLTRTIDLDALKNDPNYLAEYEKELAPVVEQYAFGRTSGISGWVYFDPKWSDTPHDVYYVDGDGDGIPDRQDYIPFSYYDNTPIPTDDKYWWYGPIEEGHGVWTNPYNWELRNNEIIHVVSYACPVYIEGEFIGVAGSYYRFDQMQEEISRLKAFENGYATLFNEKLDVIIHPYYYGGTRQTSDNLSMMQDSQSVALCETLLHSSYGLFSCNDQEKSVIAYSKLSNGWILGLTARESEMYAGLYRLVFLLILAVAICLLISAVVSYLMGRLIARPILNLAKAAQRIGAGDFSIPVEVQTKDEVALLANSMNAMVQNIEDLKQEIEHTAYYDDLTGVRNLVKFKLDAHELLLEHPTQAFMMLKMDIDQFKIFNDLHGFAEGDRLLKSMAKMLEESLNPKFELVGRINADEFVLFLRYEGMRILDRRQRLFERKLGRQTGDLCYSLVFPIGRCQIEPGETDVAAIFERVNLAHRLAKQQTGTKVCVYDHGVRQIALREKEIEAQQEIALQQGEFLLYLQPKYRLSDERIVGAEGLVRWQSAALGMLYPDQFIPIFEKNGFITKMDLYMFHKACQTIRGWLDSGVEPVVVSVNFSRLHLGTPEFVSQLCEIADAQQVPRKLLEIELTETAMFNHGDILLYFLNSLHSAGFTLSMDDFGTGYSSLGLLKNLPVDVVKLDRSFFVDGIDVERERTVISSVIDMAKKLRIHTVAEGVEDQEHIDFLRELGCDIVQGYYFAKPMPESEFTEGRGLEE